MSKIRGRFTKGGERVKASTFTIDGRLQGNGWQEFFECLRALGKKYGLNVTPMPPKDGGESGQGKTSGSKKKSARKKATAKKVSRRR